MEEDVLVTEEEEELSEDGIEFNQNNSSPNWSLWSWFDIFYGEEYYDESEAELHSLISLLWMALSGSFGCVCIFIVSTKYHDYLQALHENQFWFSNMKEVERELSFHAEQGMYYSFYKQILTASSWYQGIEQLARDNSTEYGHEINVVQHFHIYPEIFLSWLYRWFDMKSSFSIFYVNWVFWLHGVYLAILFGLAWHLSGSLTAGIVCCFYFVVHRMDATRVNYAVPLRENFAIPLIYLQIFFLCKYFHSDQWWIISVLGIFSSTVVSLLSWQLSPFVLLTEMICTVALCHCFILNSYKGCMFIVTCGMALITSCILHCYHVGLVSCLALSAVVPAYLLVVSPLQFGGWKVIWLEGFVAAIATVAINWIVKIFIGFEYDSFFQHFLKAKFLLLEAMDFDYRLLFCSNAFDGIDFEMLWRLAVSGILPLYMVELGYLWWHCGGMKVSTERKYNLDQGGTDQYDLHQGGTEQNYLYGNVIAEHKKVDLKFFLSFSMIWAAISCFLVHLKVVWMASVCVLTGVMVSHEEVVEEVTKLLRLRKFCDSRWMNEVCRIMMALVVVTLLRCQYWSHLKSELEPENLSEFQDPDTVQLMSWIHDNTNPTVVVAGSMQLMAAVKLTTSRTVVNHPVYGHNLWLQEQTQKLYQIYGRHSGEFIHAMLMNSGVSLVVIEESICKESDESLSHPFCRIVDIIDLHNGHIPEGDWPISNNLNVAKFGRFCKTIQVESNQYGHLFSLAMSNAMYRVYYVLQN